MLTHLNLLHKGRPTNAAMLLFGKSLQRFLLSSEIKCAHFYGTQVTKPIRPCESRLEHLLREGSLETTVPDKPGSPLQKYQLTDEGTRRAR